MDAEDSFVSETADGEEDLVDAAGLTDIAAHVDEAQGGGNGHRDGRVGVDVASPVGRFDGALQGCLAQPGGPNFADMGQVDEAFAIDRVGPGHKLGFLGRHSAEAQFDGVAGTERGIRRQQAAGGREEGEKQGQNLNAAGHINSRPADPPWPCAGHGSALASLEAEPLTPSGAFRGV